MNYVIRLGTRQDRYVSMREFSILSMSDSTMAVSSKYTQDLSVQIVSFTFSFKWFLCFYFSCNLSYIVDLFASLHELASAIARTLLKFASSVRVLLKPYAWRHLKVIRQYCIAHPYCARFSRHQRAQISACTYTAKEISLKLSTIAK